MANIDDGALKELITESQDLHVDAMRGIKETIPALEDMREERRGQEIDTDEIDRFNANRRSMLRQLGYGAGGIAGRGLLAGSFGTILSGLIASPARADRNLDVQILQTASSLEKLAVETYNAAASQNLGGVAKVPGSAGQVVVQFVMTTMKQHDEHKKGFQAQTTALGGQVQDSPNPKFQAEVTKAVPGFKQPVDVVDFAAVLEKVATDTYLVNLTQLEDMKSKEIMGSVMGVEAQHLASLRAVSALLKGGAPQLIKIPLGADLAKLPAAAGSVAFPKAFEEVGPVAEPETGAVK